MSMRDFKYNYAVPGPVGGLQPDLRVSNLACALPIAFMPFTSAFALGSWFPLTLVATICSLGLLLLSPSRKVRFEPGLPDLPLILAIGFGFLGLFFAPEHGRRTLNHSLAIVTCAAFYFFFFRDNILRNISIFYVSRIFAKIGLLVGSFIILEFVAMNIFNVRFSEFVVYKEIEKDEAELFDSLMLGQWIRPRGLAVEAGHMASYFEVSLPISLIWLRSRKILSQSLHLIPVVIGFLLLSSAAGIVALTVAITVVLVKSRISLGIKSAVVVVALILGIWVVQNNFYAKYIDPLVAQKALGFFGVRVTDDTSALDRSARALSAVNIANAYPLGIGWGTAAHLSKDSSGLDGADIPFGFVSLYAEFLVAGGWIGVIFIGMFVGGLIIRMWFLRGFAENCILVSMISVAIHFGTMSNYWFPSFWVPFALASILKSKSAIPMSRLSRFATHKRSKFVRL